MSSVVHKARHSHGLNPTNLPPLVQTLGGILASAGTSAYLVGGAVRDALLGRETLDIDLAVEGSAQMSGRGLAERLGGRLVLLDVARDIVRVVLPGADGASTIDITSFHGSIEEDLSRRDFTFDAMAVPMSEPVGGDIQARLIDPYRGVDDLRRRCIRALRPSVFGDDPGRLMRAPRLAAQLGFKIEAETDDAVRQHAHLLPKVAVERVRDELLKLLAEPGGAASLRLLDGLGLLTKVIPELADARGVTQPKEHRWDVFDHSIEAVGRVDWLMGMAPDAKHFVVEATPTFPSFAPYFAQVVSDGHTRLTLLRLAALLHDVSKPATRTVEPTGRIRFLGHHKEGSKTTERILTRLRLSRRGVELVRDMVEHHLRPGQLSQVGQMPTARAVYRYYRDTGDAAIGILYLNLADYLAARGPYLGKQEWLDRCAVVRCVLQERLAPSVEERVNPLVDGHEIMDRFSLSPGPLIGDLIELVRESRGGGEIGTKEEALELVKSRLRSGDANA